MSEGDHPSTPLRHRTFQGVLWSGLGNIGLELTRITVTLVLARIMSPREFGLVAMVVILSGLVQVVIDEGFGSAIIQKKQVHDAHLSSAFWASLDTT